MPPLKIPHYFPDHPESPNKRDHHLLSLQYIKPVLSVLPKSGPYNPSFLSMPIAIVAFIHSVLSYVSSGQPQYLLDSPCYQTFFSRIHPSYYCLHYPNLTLPWHQLQKGPLHSGFPFLCCLVCSYAGLCPASGAAPLFSYLCSHCTFSWNSLSSFPCASLTHSSGTGSNIITFTKSCLNPPNLM